MDRGALILLIPVLALVIGLAGTVFGGLVRLQKARGDRRVGHDDVVGRLDALEQEVETLQRQLSEAQERLDFAERLLSRAPPDRRE